MAPNVKLNEIEQVLSDLEYPIAREEVVTECNDVTIVLADGEENLGALVASSSDDRFESMDDLEMEIKNLLPRHAVGEPHQSEGEG